MDPEQKKAIARISGEIEDTKHEIKVSTKRLKEAESLLAHLIENAHTPAELTLAEARAKAEFYEECFGIMRKALIDNNIYGTWVGWDGQPDGFRKNQIKKELGKMDTEAKE